MLILSKKTLNVLSSKTKGVLVARTQHMGSHVDRWVGNFGRCWISHDDKTMNSYIITRISEEF